MTKVQYITCMISNILLAHCRVYGFGQNESKYSSTKKIQWGKGLGEGGGLKKSDLMGKDFFRLCMGWYV